MINWKSVPVTNAPRLYRYSTCWKVQWITKLSDSLGLFTHGHRTEACAKAPDGTHLIYILEKPTKWNVDFGLYKRDLPFADEKILGLRVTLPITIRTSYNGCKSINSIGIRCRNFWGCCYLQVLQTRLWKDWYSNRYIEIYRWFRSSLLISIWLWCFKRGPWNL